MRRTIGKNIFVTTCSRLSRARANFFIYLVMLGLIISNYVDLSKFPNCVEESLELLKVVIFGFFIKLPFCANKATRAEHIATFINFDMIL